MYHRFEVTNQDSQNVDELLKAGSYQKAAELAENRGEFLRSAEIYAKTWNFEKAVHTALKVDATLKALKWAIDSKKSSLMDTCDLSIHPESEVFDEAVGIYTAKHLEHRAAGLLENAGDLSKAGVLYTKSKEWIKAAKCHLKLNNTTEAKRCLEKQLEKTSESELLGESHLLLGQLDQHLSRNEEAVKHFQHASKSDKWHLVALKELIRVYKRLGLTTAARDTLGRARQLDSSLPSALDAYLALPKEPSNLFAEAVSAKVAGRYTLERTIGKGGSGKVHLAFDEMTQKKVALKMISDMQNQENPLFKRFIRETEIAGGLKHKNIIEVHDVSASLGYIAMEFMSGGSLDTHIEHKVLLPNRVKSITKDVISALQVAHAQGVIHRDIKPANIFLDAGGTAKLGDFGVAHLLDLGQTQTGGLIGTLAYMSPEQMTGASIGPKADQYSLAVTLFQCLTGRLPFQGPDFIAEHLGHAPPKPSEINKALLPWDKPLLRALSKSPADRFESLKEFALAIEDLSIDTSHKPMVMPNPTAQHHVPKTHADGPSPPTANTTVDHSPRYTLLDVVHSNEYATLTSGLDNVLGRSVHFEKWHQPLSHEESRRLKALSKGNPYLQKILSFEEQTHTVIYEAPIGQPLSVIASALDNATLLKILKLVTQVCVTYEHDLDFKIKLDPAHVMVDKRHIPTLLIAGTKLYEATPKSQLDDIRMFSSNTLGCNTSWNDIAQIAGPSSPSNVNVKSVRDAYRLFETLQHASSSVTG